MIPKALQAYTLLGAFKDQYGSDIIDVHIPLLVKSMMVRNIKVMNSQNVLDIFKADYGIDSMTHGAAVLILKRMCKKQLLERDGQDFKVIENKLNHYVGNMPEDIDISGVMHQIKNDIKSYAYTNFSLKLTDADVENGLLDFFNKYDGALFFEEPISNNSKIRSNDSLAKKLKFIISEYILKIANENQEIYQALLKFAKGHMIASLISTKGFRDYQGNLNNLQVYLDTPIIFHLLGLADKGVCSMSSEMVDRFKELKAQLKISQAHYNEVDNSIKFAVNLLSSDTPDWEKSNRLATYARENGVTAEVLNAIRIRLDSELTRHGITRENRVAPPPDYNDVSPIGLKEYIISRYTENHKYWLPQYKIASIENDRDTIVDIFRLRGTERHTAIANARAILVTVNKTIADAAIKVGQDHPVEPIPPCIENELMSAILWSNYPKKNDNINEEILVYACSRNIAIKNEIVVKFYKDLKEKKIANAITDEEYLAAQSSSLIVRYLKESTYNSLDYYTDSTAKEIATRVLQRQKEETEQKEDELNTIKSNLRRQSQNYAKNIIVVLWLILVAFAIFIRFGIKLSLWLKWAESIATIFLTLWGLLSWFGIIPGKDKTIEWLSDKIFNRRLKSLTQY